MKNKRISKIAISFSVLVLLVVVLLLSNSLRRSSHIVLAEESSSAASGSDAPTQGDNGVTEISVTPETVQAAIETLHRPENYTRTITVETLWSGGSSTLEMLAAVSGAWNRTDTTQADGRIRHVITDGKTSYIWYDSEKTCYSGAAGTISADQEQHIPTYEDLLALPVEKIAAADYRTLSGVRCIYLETTEDAAGYAERYWVSVDTGLLAAAEKLEEGETVYRMASLTLKTVLPSTADFTLPDGTVLHTMA